MLSIHWSFEKLLFIFRFTRWTCRMEEDDDAHLCHVCQYTCNFKTLCHCLVFHSFKNALKLYKTSDMLALPGNTLLLPSSEFMSDYLATLFALLEDMFLFMCST